MKNNRAKPFLKWAGGKSQLINEIEKILPIDITKNRFTFIEPFVGSGAVLFWMINNFPKLEKAVINDRNEDLINTYRIIVSRAGELISILETLQNEFHSLEGDEEKKKRYYYKKRALYNARKEEQSEQAALFIFLNRTCYNGLYRVNSKNLFNVPIGNYRRPTICDKENILAVSRALQKVVILCGDYRETLHYATDNSLFYFDPPYKPLNLTSNFNAYAREKFNDSEQIRLKEFCVELDSLNYPWILSNSDVRGKDKDDNFFDDLYAGFHIHRVNARRNINSNSSRRGMLTELLITNQLRR